MNPNTLDTKPVTILLAGSYCRKCERPVLFAIGKSITNARDQTVAVNSDDVRRAILHSGFAECSQDWYWCASCLETRPGAAAAAQDVREALQMPALYGISSHDREQMRAKAAMRDATWRGRR